MNSSNEERARNAMRVSAALGVLMSFLGGCATTPQRRPLPVEPSLDLSRYLGTWYEIAHFPQRFQKGCVGTTATYRRRPDGKVEVLNRCRDGSLDGPERVARGVARVPDSTESSKLEVSFFRPFWGDYWVLEVGEQYEYAVVGHPSRDYLWILSRTPTMDPQTYRQVLERVRALGFDLERLVRTPQRAAESAAKEVPS